MAEYYKDHVRYASLTSGYIGPINTPTNEIAMASPIKFGVNQMMNSRLLENELCEMRDPIIQVKPTHLKAKRAYAKITRRVPIFSRRSESFQGSERFTDLLVYPQQRKATYHQT